MSNKSEKKKENKNYTEDYKLDLSLLYYRIKISTIKTNFIERKLGIELSEPDAEIFLLN